MAIKVEELSRILDSNRKRRTWLERKLKASASTDPPGPHGYDEPPELTAEDEEILDAFGLGWPLRILCKLPPEP